MEKEVKNIYYRNYKEIMEFQKKLDKIWSARIINKFGVKDFRKIPVRKYLAPEGGYRIPEDMWWELDERQKSFFRNKVKRYGHYVYFRGYSYYSNDNCLHKKENTVNNKQAFSRLVAYWKQYREHIHCIEQIYDKKLKWVDYLAIISFLEWVWNDLSTLSWVALVKNEQLYEQMLIRCIDVLAEAIVDCTYYYFLGGRDVEWKLDLDNLLAVFSKENEKYLFNPIRKYIDDDVYLFRSLREGDQLWIVLVNYEFKLLPWVKKRDYPKVLFLNNAFGGINIGFFFKQLMKLDAEALNVYSSVHEEEMNRNVTFAQIDFRYSTANYDYIIAIDDSIFTGRSLEGITDSIGFPQDRMVYLPMTYDVSTYFNHPEELNFFERSALDTAIKVEKMARSIEEILPPARSYWAYKKTRILDGQEKEYHEKINGSDLLMRILWKRFEKEIKNEKDN